MNGMLTIIWTMLAGIMKIRVGSMPSDTKSKMHGNG